MYKPIFVSGNAAITIREWNPCKRKFEQFKGITGLPVNLFLGYRGYIFAELGSEELLRLAEQLGLSTIASGWTSDCLDWGAPEFQISLTATIYSLIIIIRIHSIRRQYIERH